MGVAWGIVLVALSLLAWGGQSLSWVAPKLAARLSVAEAEDTVEATYWADIRGEALWDLLTLWTLLVAGVLLIFDAAAWPYFGLAGGAVYVYFGGRGVVTRLEMQRRGFRIGTSQNVRAAYSLLVIWGIVGGVTIIAAASALAAS
jgi:hypothetical protein